MKLKTLLPALLLAAMLGAPPARAGTEITLFRFFGGCSDEYANVTDLSKAVGECGIIQVLTNKFNAENKDGITVKTQSVEWGVYYDRLSANVAGRTPPDIAVMHRSVLPNYQVRNLLLPLGKDFAEVGIDVADFVPAAREGVTANGEIWALPFDLHALLWHVNADLFIQAGLVDDAGPAEAAPQPGRADATRRDDEGRRRASPTSPSPPARIRCRPGIPLLGLAAGRQHRGRGEEGGAAGVEGEPGGAAPARRALRGRPRQPPT